MTNPPRLRLRRDDGDEAEPSPAVVFPFPNAKVRSRLVAGRVEGDPCADAGVPQPLDSERPGRLRLRRGDGTTPTSAPEIIRELERTLDRMQTGLERFRRQMDGALKFPPPAAENEDGWPPRAA